MVVGYQHFRKLPYSWMGCEKNCPLGNDHVFPTTSQHVYVWVDDFPAFPWKVGYFDDSLLEGGSRESGIFWESRHESSITSSTQSSRWFNTWPDFIPQLKVTYLEGVTYPSQKGHKTNCQDQEVTFLEWWSVTLSKANRDLQQSGIKRSRIESPGFSWIFVVNSREKPTTTRGKSKLLQAHLSTEQKDKVPVKQVWNCGYCCNTLFAYSSVFFRTKM